MAIHRDNPRVLVVTPEVTYLPEGMGDKSHQMRAKAGGLADVSAALINALYRQGADVHVALPDYRTLFNRRRAGFLQRKLNALKSHMPGEKIHLAQDRAFYYMNHVYSGDALENIRISLAFQREVINHIAATVKPDLIHCNDWMTGLIPAMARQMEIPCLFTIHNVHTAEIHLAAIEDRGIDAATFWQNLYYKHYPGTYEYTRESIPVDFMLSGIFGAHFINTVSPRFLSEMIEGRYGFVGPALRRELANKKNAGCAVGILNAPDPSFNPLTDGSLHCNYAPESNILGKRANKGFLQQKLGLVADVRAPLFFWPSRLDPVQKGCQLLTEIVERIISNYRDHHLQVVLVADGSFQNHFHDIVRWHNLGDRLAVCGFDEHLSRLAYGAADFVLMPSSFEPCGLPQMIGAIYGALPVVHDTGGLHDTVSHMDSRQNTGNGFVFETFDAGGLTWAIDQAMAFHLQPVAERDRQIRRIMEESARRFNHHVTARQYMTLYEKMLRRPLVDSTGEENLEDAAGSAPDPRTISPLPDLTARIRKTHETPEPDRPVGLSA